jgi:threonine/homoserine/homoserine lactone efflux protein
MTDSQSGLLAGGVLLGLSVAAPLGPVNIAMIQRGLSEGFAGACLLGLGSTTADLIYILLAYAGADPLSHLSWARFLLFAAGAGVMGWLGWGAIWAALHPAPAAIPVEGAGPGGRRSAYASGFLITIVNPMTIAFWLGILSAALAARERAPLVVEGLYIGSLAAGCLLWVLTLSTVLHFGRQVAGGGALRWVSGVAGVALLGFGLQFAVKAFAVLTGRT